MKKTTLLKNLLKSPPISAKSFKSTQKYQFTPNDVPEYPSAQQTLKMRMEKINESLNQQIKQRQFQFKQLYKMITDLQKSKKSKCKHNVVTMEKTPPPQEIGHIPFTVLQNNFKSRQINQSLQLTYSPKSPFTINDSNQLNLLKKQNTENTLMKKENRKSKFGTIKSHKYLPTIYSSSQSIQMQNEQQMEEDQKQHLQTTTSQVFSNSHSYFNFNFQQKQIISPSQSILSNSSIQKTKSIVEVDLKISYFENKLKSLESSHNFLKEKVQKSLLKQTDISQQIKTLNSKIESSPNEKISLVELSDEINRKLKQIELKINQKYQEVSQEVSNNFKNIQNLIYESKRQKTQFSEQLHELSTRIDKLQSSQIQIESIKVQMSEIQEKSIELHSNNQNQALMISRIEALQLAQGDLFKQFGDMMSLKDEKLQSSNINQVRSQTQSVAEPFFYNEKISEVQSRLQNTEEIVSELMKVSLTLTQKINKLTNSEENMPKKADQIKNLFQKELKCKQGLSQGYWSLKQELNKIDEEPIESSRQIIDESFLYNEENEEAETVQVEDQQINQEIQVQE